MAQEFEHLRIEKEPINNPRRSGRPPRFKNRSDLVGHGQKLSGALASTTQAVKQQLTSRPGHYVLKLKYEDTLSFNELVAHGVEFVSQEDIHICVVFTTEQGLATFSDHLAWLGLDDKDITRKQLLEALTSIEAWNAEDRKSWALKQYGLPQDEIFTLDVELWPSDLSASPQRKELVDAFEQWLVSNNIERKDKVNLDSLLMYRLMVDRNGVGKLLNHSDVRFIDLPPLSGIDYQTINRDISSLPADIQPPHKDAPRICILDSGINTNHPLLKNAVAESASFVEGEDEFDAAGHGTQVAGIALYGNLEECNRSNYWVPEAWLFNGKILNKHCEFNAQSIESTLVKAVEYFVGFGCRIFNLSIGNENSPYDGKHIRGIAYILDLLARKHDILFVVSVGNFRGCDEPPVPAESWREEYPGYLLGDHNRIIDPAPALNVLTVGSLALHDATRGDLQRPEDIDHLAAAKANQPSPFTRHGPTVKGAIKPELVAYGGNFASPMRFEGKQWQVEDGEPGILSLNPNFVGNTLFSVCHGTSFSAPYITHLAGRLLVNYPDASANLLRAILVNHADMPDECLSTFSDEVKKAYSKANGRRDPQTEVAGYGLVNEENLYRSDESAVLLMAEDSISNDSYQFYELPLPEEFLRRKKSARELRVSLSYSPAVRTTRLDYRATKIVFNLVKGRSLDEVQKHFHKELQKDKDRLSDTVSSKANRTISSELRSKGSVQCSKWNFKKLSPDFKWFVVVTRQDAAGWGGSLSAELEKYALVVTVTDRENEEARLYSQISQKIEQQVQARAKV
ncbi:S8 family peptidase [Halioxenophilus aromaticivorans]|uniref:S8 family peptidase n=1 Tax=Halioxenophilus aromaticivorans TaxID=1306992 RepID=A0AAV3U8A8_9ALTE